MVMILPPMVEPLFKGSCTRFSLEPRLPFQLFNNYFHRSGNEASPNSRHNHHGVGGHYIIP